MNEAANAVLDIPIVWTMDEPLTRISIFSDWDYVTSSIGALRYYWHQFGTVPHWDLTMCGGKPTLANPNAWGFTWPSVLAYLFEPVWAIFAFWTILTSVGLLSMWFLLRRFGLSRFACLCGTFLYAFNGFFSSHFNQGHYGFASFHLVPLLILLFDICLVQLLEKKKARRALYGLILVSFMFFSAAIPHALFHFYPLLPIYLAIRFFDLKHIYGSTKVWRSMLVVGLMHLLGLWLAVYKWGPVLAWQINTPRQGVTLERITLAQAFDHFWRFMPDYLEAKRYFADQVWGYWEYNAFIGPFALLISCGAVIAFAARWLSRKPGKSATPGAPGFLLSIICIILGLSLVLGNDSPFSPTSFFRYIPVLNGIRVFGRYHIIDLTGFVILTAYGLSILFLFVCAPGLIQSGNMMWNIQGLSYRFLENNIYTKLPPAQQNPILAKPWQLPYHIMTQTFLLDHGYFSAECYEPLSGVHLNLSGMPVGFMYPLTTASRFKFADASTNSFSFDFGDDINEKVQVNLAVSPNFKPNIPGQINASGLLVYEPQQIRGKRLTIDTTIPADTWSAVISGVGLLATGLVCFLI